MVVCKDFRNPIAVALSMRKQKSQQWGFFPCRAQWFWGTPGVSPMAGPLGIDPSPYQSKNCNTTEQGSTIRKWRYMTIYGHFKEGNYDRLWYLGVLHFQTNPHQENSLANKFCGGKNPMPFASPHQAHPTGKPNIRSAKGDSKLSSSPLLSSRWRRTMTSFTQ